MGLDSLLYNIGLGAYHTGIQLSAPFNPKARQWVAGRKDWQQQLKALLNGKPVVWVHCASLGEYEQGKPVVDALEVQYPNKQVMVSFYSPSGYEVVKRREPHRAIVYLPADTEANAEVFLQLLQPTLAIFIKYEFWYHYLQQLKHRQVPTLLVSGIFRPRQAFFKPWGGLHREMLGCFTHFFVQDKDSEQLLKGIGFNNVSVSGDTRFDRVGAILANPQKLEIIENFKADCPIFIAGSTWPADERILLPYVEALLTNGWKVVIAPHELNPEHIKQLQKQLGNRATTYSAHEPGKSVMIIDNVGLLASIYQYGELAYIGGGFGKGIHNILEAAANGLPVIFGPNYSKFKEARELVALGGAFCVGSLEDLSFRGGIMYADEDEYAKASQAAYHYVLEKQGATAQVMQWIMQMAL